MKGEKRNSRMKSAGGNRKSRRKADQIQEYGNRGFTVLLPGMSSLPGKGVWVSQLKKELSARGVEMPATKNLPVSGAASGGSTKKSLGGFLR